MFVCGTTADFRARLWNGHCAHARIMHRKLQTSSGLWINMFEMEKYCSNCCIVPRCSVTLAPPSYKQIVQYESNKPINSELIYRQSINQSTARSYYEVLPPSLWRFVVILDWLIDLIHRRKNCPRGRFPGGSKSDRTPRDNTVLDTFFTPYPPPPLQKKTDTWNFQREMLPEETSESD